MASDSVISYDDIEDFRYNPFTGVYTPKKIGYGAIPPEIRTIPNDGVYQIKLFEMPQSGHTVITVVVSGEVLVEVNNDRTLQPNQFTVFYSGLGLGIVQFHSSKANVQVSIQYYGLGHNFQKVTLDAFTGNRNGTKIIVSSDTPTSQTVGADYEINTTVDASTDIQAAIDAVNSAGGGVVYLMDGNYNIENQLVMKDNVILEGMSWETIINKNALLGSNGMIDCSAANNIMIKKILLDMGGSSFDESGYGIEDDNNYENRFEYVKVQNGYSTSSPTDSAGGFWKCNNLFFCEADTIENSGAVTLTNSGYYQCYNLVECNAFNCTQIGGGGNVRGFGSCRTLSNCYAANNDEGFGDCRHMMLNRSTGNSAQYSNSFADWGGAAAVADTSAGGWNA